MIQETMIPVLQIVKEPALTEKNILFCVVEIQFPEDVPVGVIRDVMAILARYIRVLSPKAVIHMEIMQR